MNLGTALRQLPSGDKKRNILRAIRCYRQALLIDALVQYNLGSACLELPGEPEHVAKTLACFTAAFECAKSSGYTEIERLAGAQLDGLRLLISSSSGAQASL
jgi:hypothetical protein